MKAVHGDQCVDASTVRRSVRRFKDGELGKQVSKTKHLFFKGRILKTSAAFAAVY